jgi:protein O-mannosyl-transferase
MSEPAPQPTAFPEVPRPPLPGGRQDLRSGLGALCIFVLVLVVYWPALWGGFVWDDQLLVARNPLVTGEAKPGSIWFQMDFPLTVIAFWLQWLAWGAKPFGYHAVNIALHALNAVLLWRLLARLRVPGAWLAGILFAVHPICVASVAWISELKNTLSLTFYLASLYCYARNLKPSPKWYALSLLAFLIALLSKTSTVMLPMVLLGMRWWQRQPLGLRDLLRLGPFFLLSIAFGGMTVWFQTHGLLKGVAAQTEGFWARLAAAGWASWFYLGKALLPINLNLMYPRWTVDAAAPVSYLPLLLLAALFVLLWCYRATWARHPLFALFCFVVTLLPVLGFVDMYFLNISRVSDHFQYLPITALIALAAAALCNPKLLSAFPRLQDAPLRNVAIAGIILAFSFLTLQRARVFATDEGLWRDTLARNPDAWSAHNNLGCILAEKGELEAAAQHFEASLGIKRDNAQAHENLGQIRSIQGHTAEAQAHLESVLKIKPNDAQAHRLLANCLASENKNQEALLHFSEALRLAPDADTRLEFASLLQRTGNTRQALAELRQVLAAQPDMPAALNNAAWLLATAADGTVRDGPEAVRLAERACQLTQYKERVIVGTLAAAYAEAGRFDEAVVTAQKAINLATAAGDEPFAATNQQLLEFYRSGKAWHAVAGQPAR